MKAKMSTGADIMITTTVAELIDHHVSLEVESIDRLYLNAYQPRLQTGGGVVAFFREQRDAKVASTVLMAPMSKAFVAEIEHFARDNELDIVPFKKGQRKDDETQKRLREFKQDEGVLYIGKAQEKFPAFRMSKKISAETGAPYPWLYRSTVMCNQYYFYIVDEDFGPLFIKFSSYFPYTARVCLNGHEYLKRQLGKEGIAFEPLDNGISTCADPFRMQQIADELDAEKIQAVVTKWFARLPCAFSPEDEAAGYRYELSILQAEFARTQVFERPLSGRRFFEEVIRENIDIGRPDQVSLVFKRRITKRTPGKFRTRIITEGVFPSLHVSYKSSKIKQYFKEGRALRTETVINNTRDFGIGRKLSNLPALRDLGFDADKRLLDVEKLNQDCYIGAEVFRDVTHPKEVDGQRAAALKFEDMRVMALFHALCLFWLLPTGFRNANLRECVAQFMALSVEEYTRGQMTYDLRRLRLHGMIARLPGTHRYEVMPDGIKIALFFIKIQERVLEPGIAQLFDSMPDSSQRPVAAAMHNLEKAVDKHVRQNKLIV